MITTFPLFLAVPARADMFGGDVAMLVQILANALQQLVELKSIVDNGKDNIELLRDINRGINDSLNLIRTIAPDSDPGLYKDWDKVSEALNKVQNIYGIAAESKDAVVQKDTDQAIAEAISLNNSVYKYSKEIDEIGELIKAESHAVSPGGAAKLTAQSLGVMLNVQNQMLRTQATGLKLQAQAMALQNRKDKEQTREVLRNGTALKSALAAQPTKFTLPRF
jgi:hypothetical protein